MKKKKSSRGWEARYRPMLTTLIDRPFNLQNWLFEVKWDGYRAIAHVRDGKVRLYSRRLRSFEKKFKVLLPSLKCIGRNAVLDGEIVALDEKGNSSFSLLQEYLRTGEGEIVYYVFDILFIDDKDVRELPLLRRKALLQQVIPDLPNVRVSEFVRGRGVDFFNEARKRGHEGIVAKAAQSTYREGTRNGKWLKIKTHLRQEFVIGGFTLRRTETALASLLIGVFEEGRLHFVGEVLTGFEGKPGPGLLKRLLRLHHTYCRFENVPITHAHSHWVRPEIVCEVSFRKWSPAGLVCDPWYDGLRIDKPATKVKREHARPVARALREKATTPSKHGLHLIT